MKLSEYRAREGLTQTEFAEQIGVTQGTLSRMERGLKPCFDTMQRIWNVTGKVDPNSFFERPKK